MTDPTQKPATTTEWLSAADCASRTGLTVRALRVYERQGLITPPRSPNGWRRYGPQELARLNSIVILKGLGLTLSQIRSVLAENAPSLQRILQAHEESWQTKRTVADHALSLVRAALQRLQAKQSLSIDELCDLIKKLETHRSVDMNSASALTRRLINENMTPEEERAWATWCAEHPDDVAAMHAFTTDHRALMDEVQRLMEQSVDPAAPQVQVLVQQFNLLLRKHSLRERNRRLRAWNYDITQKMMGLGVKLSRLKDDGKGAQLFDYWIEVLRHNSQYKVMREIALEIRYIMNKHVDPGSALMEAPLARLRQLCQESDLGDARLQLEWARFNHDVLKPHLKEQPDGYFQQEWEFALRALESRETADVDLAIARGAQG